MIRALAALLLAFGSVLPRPAAAQTEPFIGQIMVFGGSFCPRGWAAAEGQLLAISENEALFSILGTTYGGDGRTTFALPDLRGRVIAGPGTGPGLPAYRLGQPGGAATRTLGLAQMPRHTHDVTVGIDAAGAPATAVSPRGNLLAVDTGDATYAPDGAPTVAMAPGMARATAAETGGSAPLDVRDPYLPVTICIALRGLFPSRN